MGNFSKVSTSRACVRGAAMCDRGPNNDQVLTEGPQGSSSLVGTMSRNAGAIFAFHRGG